MRAQCKDSPQGRPAQGFAELVGRPESDCKALRWHSWRRNGAPWSTDAIVAAMGGLGNAEYAQSVRVSAQQLEFRPRWSAAGRHDRRTQESHALRKGGHHAAALGAVDAGRHRDGG